jgi:hypothetical protein
VTTAALAGGRVLLGAAKFVSKETNHRFFAKKANFRRVS